MAVALLLVSCSSSPAGRTRGFEGEARGRSLQLDGGGADANANPVSFALVIGVDDYADERIHDLALAKPDASAIAGFLADRDGGGLEAERVISLTGEHATRDAVVGALDTLGRALRPQDTLILYLSCHGYIPPGEQQVWFLMHDTDPANVAETGIRMQRVLGFLETCPARQVVFFADACHSGATAADDDLAARQLDAYQQAQQRLAGKDMLILASCSANQEALELESLGHGVFTWFLLEGLREFGDANRDGIVSSGELAQYVTNEVERFVASPPVQADFAGFRQTPRPFAVGRDVPLLDVARNPQGLSLHVHYRCGDGITQDLVGYQRLPGRYPTLADVRTFRVEVTSDSATPVPAAVIRWTVSDDGIVASRLLPDGQVQTDALRTVTARRSLRFPDADRTGLRDATAWVPEGLALYLLVAGRELSMATLDELESRVGRAIDPSRPIASMRDDVSPVLDDAAFAGLLFRRVVCFHGAARDRYLAVRIVDDEKPQGPAGAGGHQ
ncbi:MAG: caspase domain-containing protein [Planctomycetota bacterium]